MRVAAEERGGGLLSKKFDDAWSTNRMDTEDSGIIWQDDEKIFNVHPGSKEQNEKINEHYHNQKKNIFKIIPPSHRRNLPFSFSAIN